MFPAFKHFSAYRNNLMGAVKPHFLMFSGRIALWGPWRQSLVMVILNINIISKFYFEPKYSSLLIKTTKMNTLFIVLVKCSQFHNEYPLSPENESFSWNAT